MIKMNITIVMISFIYQTAFANPYYEIDGEKEHIKQFEKYISNIQTQTINNRNKEYESKMIFEYEDSINKKKERIEYLESIIDEWSKISPNKIINDYNNSNNRDDKKKMLGMMSVTVNKINIDKYMQCIISALKDSDSIVRDEAATTIRAFIVFKNMEGYLEIYIDKIIEILKNEKDGDVINSMVWAFGILNNNRMIDEILNVMKKECNITRDKGYLPGRSNPSVWMRMALSKRISEFNTNKYKNKIDDIIRNDNENGEMKYYLAYRMAEKGDKSVEPTLVEALQKSNDGNLRNNVIVFINSKKAIPVLLKALNDQYNIDMPDKPFTYYAVRESAYIKLHEFGIKIHKDNENKGIYEVDESTIPPEYRTK